MKRKLFHVTTVIIAMRMISVAGKDTLTFHHLILILMIQIGRDLPLFDCIIHFYVRFFSNKCFITISEYYYRLLSELGK